MAAGVYNTDLKDINLCETTTDFSALGGGASGLGAGVDFAIQGTNAVDKLVSNALKGMVYDTGSAITLGAGEHILIWMICSTPGITSAQSAGGLRITVGTGTNAYREWYVNGNDTLPAGGMQNYAIHTSSTADNTQGSPGANPQFFGGQADVTATAKGVNFALDAMRYGTGLYLTQGDATTPITFTSASDENDLTANRYGIFEAIPGGFSHKGRFVIGQDPNFNTTQSYFTDSNKSIVFKDTPQSLSDFTKIIVDHPSTFFSIRAVNFTAEGTNNPGQLVFNDSITTGSIVNCQFNDFGKTFLQANVEVTGSSFNSTDTIFQSGSTLFDSAFRTTTGESASVLVDDPSKLSFNAFNNEGSKHGIEVIVTGSYVFEANIFENFVSGSNANEALYFNPPGGTGDLTLQIIGGGTTVDFRNASSGTVTIENNASITVTGLQDNTEVRIFDSATEGPQTELAGIENATDGTSGNRSFTFTLPVGTIVDIVLISVQYENERLNDFELTVTQNLPFEQVFDRNYSNPGNPEIDALFSSLQSRSTYYGNETESKTFVENLDDLGLFTSASHIYPAAGVSDNTIHSLLPSASSGDLITSSFTSISAHTPRQILRLNSSRQYYTASSDALPVITFNHPGQLVSGSFSIEAGSTTNSKYELDPDLTFGWVNATNNNFRFLVTLGLQSTTTGTNTVLTYPDTSITQKVISGDIASISDDNSGGSKEVSITITGTSAFDTGAVAVLCKSIGANYIYLSGSGITSARWFNLSDGTIGSDLYSGSVSWPRIIDQGDGWYETVLLSSGSGAAGDYVIGLSDTDGGKTVTADGTNKLYINLLQMNRRLAGISLGPKIDLLHANDTDASVPLAFTINYFNQTSNPLTTTAAAGVFYVEVGWDSFWEDTSFVSNTFGNAPTIGVANFASLASSPSSTTTGIRITRYVTGTGASITRGIRITMNGLGQSPVTPFNLITVADATTTDILAKGGFLKVAIRRDDANNAIYVNGTSRATSTATLGTLAIESFFNAYSGRFRNIAYFPHALTNAQMEALTS